MVSSICLDELNTFYKTTKKQDLALQLLALKKLIIFATNPTYLFPYLEPFLGTRQPLPCEKIFANSIMIYSSLSPPHFDHFSGGF